MTLPIIDMKTDFYSLGECLLLYPLFLQLSPLSKSFSSLSDLCLGFFPCSAVVPQQLLDVRWTMSRSSWRLC